MFLSCKSALFCENYIDRKIFTQSFSLALRYVNQNQDRV